MGLPKITFFLSDFNLGGSERQAVNLANHWKREGYAEVSFLSVREGSDIPLFLSEKEIPFNVIPFYFQWNLLKKTKSLLKIWSHLNKSKADYLICYGFQANIAGGLIWRFTQIRKCIWQQRGIESSLTSPSRLERLAFFLSASVVANSEEGKNHVMARFSSASKKNITIIYNGVLPITTTSDQSLKNRFCDRWVVVQLANLTKYKDFSTLLKGWSLFVEKTRNPDLPKPLLLLAGKGPLEVEIKAQIVDLGICDSVVLLGKIELKDVVGWPELFILSSKNEGLPNALIEPMYHGHLVCGSDILGNREALGVRHQNELLFTDAVELSNLLFNIFTHPAEFKHVASKFYHYALSKFDMQVISDQYKKALL